MRVLALINFDCGRIMESFFNEAYEAPKSQAVMYLIFFKFVK